MIIFGAIVFCLGVVLFFVQKGQKNRAYNIKSARPAQAAELQKMSASIAKEIGAGHWRDYVTVRGKITAESPLRSELTQQECVHYTMTVTREFEETITSRTSRGSSTRTQRGSESVASNTRSIPFRLEDGSGSIAVDPHGAKIDAVEVLDDFRPGEPRRGGITYGGFSLTPRYQQNLGGRLTLGYRYSESVLPVNTTVLVVGAVNDTTGEVTLRQPVGSGKKLIISSKTFEALTAAADRGARFARNGMYACLGVGSALMLGGLLR